MAYGSVQQSHVCIPGTKEIYKDPVGGHRIVVHCQVCKKEF